MQHLQMGHGVVDVCVCVCVCVVHELNGAPQVQVEKR